MGKHDSGKPKPSPKDYKEAERRGKYVGKHRTKEETPDKGKGNGSGKKR